MYSSYVPVKALCTVRFWPALNIFHRINLIYTVTAHYRNFYVFDYTIRTVLADFTLHMYVTNEATNVTKSFVK